MGVLAVEPVESHVHRLGASWLDVVGDHTVCCAVVSLNGCGRLLVAHFLSNSCMEIASRALMKRALSLTLTALDMTALRILDMLRTAPLSGGSSTLDEQKKWLPTLLCAKGLLR